MKNLNYSDGYKQRIEQLTNITVFTLWLPQFERGVTLELQPAEIDLMQRDIPGFCERYLYPALQQLSNEIKEASVAK